VATVSVKLPIARKRESYPGVARREPTFTPGVRQSSATIEGDTKRKTSTEMEDLRGSTMHNAQRFCLCVVVWPTLDQGVVAKYIQIQRSGLGLSSTSAFTSVSLLWDCCWWVTVW